MFLCVITQSGKHTLVCRPAVLNHIMAQPTIGLTKQKWKSGEMTAIEIWTSGRKVTPTEGLHIILYQQKCYQSCAFCYKVIWFDFVEFICILMSFRNTYSSNAGPFWIKRDRYRYIFCARHVTKLTSYNFTLANINRARLLSHFIKIKIIK